MDILNVEKFFLTNLLRISMGGVLLILITDVSFYPEDSLSITLDCIILTTSCLTYIIRNKFPMVAVIAYTLLLTAAMIYQCIFVPTNTTTSLSVLLVVGFTVSVMLSGTSMWIMHSLILGTINGIFVLQFNTPELRFSPSVNDIISIAVTYSILYFIVTYATRILKSSYDAAQFQLRLANIELQTKANEIEAQNEELIQVQDSLSTMNKDLERIVEERTESLRIKTEKLIKYSYTNAHHLRGPVARLLGLVAVRELEKQSDDQFFFQKIKEQSLEIDDVVKQINRELGDL